MLTLLYVRLVLIALSFALLAPACGSDPDTAGGTVSDASASTDSTAPGTRGPAVDAAVVVNASTVKLDGSADTVVTGNAAKTDTGITTAADGSTTPAATTTCNALALVNSGPQVEGTRVAESRPAPTGGTIVSGTYHYTASKTYTGPGGATGGVNSFFKLTAKIEDKGNGIFSMEIVDTEIGKHTDKRTSSTFTISGTKMNLNVACPGTAALSFDFSATATTYSMWGANDNKIHVHTKQ